eukprot:5176934-Alexandrium_andersonii.AAC.1
MEPNTVKGVSPRRCPRVRTSLLHAPQLRAEDDHYLRVIGHPRALGARGLTFLPSVFGVLPCRAWGSRLKPRRGASRSPRIFIVLCAHA